VLEERLKLQKLISDISGNLINVPAKEVDEHILNSLRQVVMFLGLDRGSIGVFSEDQRDFRITHSFALSNIEKQTDKLLSSFLPWYTGKLLQGEIVVFEKPTDMPEEAAAEIHYCQDTGLKSHFAIPIAVGGSPLCAIGFASFSKNRAWPREQIEQLKQLAVIYGQAIYRKQAELKLAEQLSTLKESYQEIKQLKDRLQAETEYLRAEIKVHRGPTEIIGESKIIQSVLHKVEQVAQTNSSVLIYGETGAGKEVIARAIHNLSPRKNRIMVKVNCSSLPPTLVESELFGREKGAYTGALTRQLGRFEAANGSTLFIDEIGELPTELQVKLLRVLQEGEFERLGSSKTIKVDVRLITATHRNLEEAVRQGKFREDLYYRLKVFPIEVPPLRDRVEDIPLLVYAFIEEIGQKMNRKIPFISKSTMEKLQSYNWPGNIRELRNMIEHAMIISDDKYLQVQLPINSYGSNTQLVTLEEAQRHHIIATLERTNWRVKGKAGAAEILGLHPATMYSKMRKLGIPLRREKDDISSKSRDIVQ